MQITWPSDEEIEVVDAIRNAIGRDVSFYYIASISGCPDCEYDPVNEASTDAFCVTCSGEYWIPTYSGEDVQAHISWGFSEQLGWVTGGQLDTGLCRVQIKYTNANSELVEKTKWLVVDGRTMLITRKILRGVKNINRILLDLEEKEND